MTYDRFKEIWTTLVTNRAPIEGAPTQVPCLYNGVSENTVDALVAVAEDDHSHFDAIQKKLSERESE
ncbi:MAG TPA: hypothetical protein VMI53_01805 [Opitutaceae bacterium]|nr:hypothetical protein [Opitutaceae bacterium]